MITENKDFGKQRCSPKSFFFFQEESGKNFTEYGIRKIKKRRKKPDKQQKDPLSE